ncbi:diaminopimelate decarboxylase [Oscillochloris sp. ZM17-4]|uniref:diaminopimelate decarboxylase n=1 Tax=Oscillochloris sp. ZM17-4 TaxID=2866714 RepID=UPI001C72EDAC|nr:diaminopimelate decarboxylase [Oscillochloris sp. ZM17-4]MBX0330611.1 diaminopimelate decarboxylase [Oscillochloris sp. ZM17-4]
MSLDSHIWPDTAEVIGGRLHIGGCDTTALAETHGTPLYLLDEATLRGAMRAYTAALARHYPGPARVHYASKALLNTAVAQIVAEEGLGLDVVSGAELLVARRAGLPMGQVHMHGNAKGEAELRRAVEWGVGAIVVDSLDELDRLAALTHGRERPQGVLLRVAPNIDTHTHAHIATGGAASKFGLPLEALGAAAARALDASGLRLLGLHAHIGSQLTRAEEFRAAVGVLAREMTRLRDDLGVELEELSPGGGLGVPYTADMPPTDIDAYAAALGAATREACAAHGLRPPLLTVEPGRSIVARAGVALYRVLARKLGPDGAPLYLHVDGGMADNIRPALYGAQYTSLLASRADAPAGPPVDVAGRYCESGDVLLRQAPLPPAGPGDLIAVAVAGAYTLSMASTYNMAPRPALLLVGDGAARLIQRRETEDDLLARDLFL